MAYDKRKKRYIIEFNIDGKWERSSVADGKAFGTKEEAQAALVAAGLSNNSTYHVRTK